MIEKLHTIYNAITFFGCVLLLYVGCIWSLIAGVSPFIGAPIAFVAAFPIIGVQHWSERKIFGYNREVVV